MKEIRFDELKCKKSHKILYKIRISIKKIGIKCIYAIALSNDY